MMQMKPSSTADLVTAYAARFNSIYATRHAVTSPLGAWLLLALLAPATSGDSRDQIESTLGIDADTAAARATTLLEAPHPAVSAAVAVWLRSEFLVEAAAEWASQLSREIERGDMPDQAQADAWASTRTNGMIEQFPLTIDPLTAAVLTSALATEVSWDEPFSTASADELGGDFAASASEVLQSKSRHRCQIIDSQVAGLVGVHAVEAASGLSVISVIGDPAVPAADMQLAAGEIAQALTRYNSSSQVSLFDLELGTHHAWTISERLVHGINGREEDIDALLVPWSASSDHDLLAAPGVPSALATMSSWLKPEYLPPEFGAKQSAVASYTRTGFKAAAVTAFGMRAASMAPPQGEGLLREATIRFNRAYAVTAIARGVDSHIAWDGVPVFSAWVEKPD